MATSSGRNRQVKYLLAERTMKCVLVVFIGLVLCGCFPSSTSTGRATVQRMEPFEQNDKFGFRDETGNIVIGPVYDDADDFAFGLAPVNVGSNRVFPGAKIGGKWGYINAQGKLVVPCTLTYAHKFSDGLAQVCDDNGLRYIDPHGQTVVTLGKVSSAGDFSEGLAPVYVDRSRQDEDCRTKFINKKGETALAVDGYAEEFHDGLAVLVVRAEADSGEGRYGFIDRTGKTIIPPQFAEALRFSEGLAAVRTKKTTVYGMGDEWGYIDKSGQYVIRPQFNEAHPFRNGTAGVHVGGALRVLFDAPPYWEGGEWRLIDARGNVLRRSREWIEYEDSAAKGPNENP